MMMMMLMLMMMMMMMMMFKTHQLISMISNLMMAGVYFSVQIYSFLLMRTVYI